MYTFQIIDWWYPPLLQQHTPCIMTLFHYYCNRFWQTLSRCKSYSSHMYRMHTILEVDKANSSSLGCEEDKGFCSSIFLKLFGYKSPNCRFIHYRKDYQPEIYHQLACKEIVGYPYEILMRPLWDLRKPMSCSSIFFVFIFHFNVRWQRNRL